MNVRLARAALLFILSGVLIILMEDDIQNWADLRSLVWIDYVFLVIYSLAFASIAMVLLNLASRVTRAKDRSAHPRG